MKDIFGGIPYTALGAQINLPPPYFWIFPCSYAYLRVRIRSCRVRAPCRSQKKVRFKNHYDVFLCYFKSLVEIFFCPTGLEKGLRKGPQGKRPMQDALQGQERGLVRAPQDKSPPQGQKQEGGRVLRVQNKGQSHIFLFEVIFIIQS